MTTIVSLQTENVKRIRAVQIEPDGSLVIIGGDNAQGKTSVLDSIMYALAGKRSLPPNPLRKGQKKGRIRVELDNGLVVTRQFVDGGAGSIRVTNKEGMLFTSPQKMLDELVGQMSFDPLAFGEKRPAERLGTLAKLLGLDFSKEDGQRAKLHDDRHRKGQEKRSAEALLPGMQQWGDTPDEEISIHDIALQLEAADNDVQSARNAESEISSLEEQREQLQIDLRERLETAGEQIKRHEEEIERIRTRVASGVAISKERSKQIGDQLPGLQEQCARLLAHEEKKAALQGQLRDAEATNARVRDNQFYAEAKAKAKVLKEEYDGLSEKMAKIDEAKAAKIAAAEFPVDGLSLGDDDVCFRGQPWEQASLAEQISVSVAMGFAMNPELRVLLIRDGSALDDEHLALVAELAQKHQGQLWLERVGDKDATAIVIEDGMVRGAEEAGAAEDAEDELPLEG